MGRVCGEGAGSWQVRLSLPQREFDDGEPLPSGRDVVFAPASGSATHQILPKPRVLPPPVPALLTGVVTVGTDHHRFDRLMDWLECWDADHPGLVSWIVQHGSSRRMNGADNFEMAAPADLLARLKAADLVVTQAGPGSIRDSRACGTIPIVVPRLAQFKEAVDDHQVAFAERLARDQLLLLAQSESEFRDAIDRAVADPASLIASETTDDVNQTVDRFVCVIDQLLARRPARVSKRGELPTFS